MIRRFLLLVVCFTLLICARAQAQDPTVTALLNSATCPGSGCVSLSSLSNRSMATVEVFDTWSGSLTVEITGSAAPVTIFSVSSKTPQNSITANGVYQVPMAGASSIRVRFSEYTSGGAVVRLTAGQGSADFTLPNGAASEATLSTVNGVLVTIATDQITGNASLNSIDSKTPSLGQASMATSVPVAIASNQSAVPVSASALPLPSGAATEATLSTLNGKVTAVNTGAVVVSSSALPSGAATAANQTTSNTSLSSIDTKTPTLVTGRVPVDGSGVTQPVSGTVGVSGSVAVTGPVTDAQIRATPLPISGTVTANAGTGTFAVSAASLPLPTNASTSALQTAGNTSLSNIDTKTPALGQAVAAASTPVVLTAAQITTLTPPAAITGFALDATLTSGNQLSRVTDGTNTATVKSAFTAAASADKALVVAVSPNNTVPVSNGDITTLNGKTIAATSSLTGNITSSTCCVTATVTGYSSAVVQIDGSWTGGGMSFECGGVSNSQQCPIYQPSTNTVTPSGFVSGGSVAVDGFYVVNVSGFDSLVILGSAITSGTANITIKLVTSGPYWYPRGTQDVSISSLALPTGASTSANQGTEIFYLSSMDTKTPALGPASSANSVPVVVATDLGSLPVTLGGELVNIQGGIVSIDASQVLGTATGTFGIVAAGKVSVAAPTYSAGEADGLSLTTAGRLRIDGSGTTQTVSGTVTANQGTAAAAANRWLVQASDGTNSMPTMDAVGRAGFQKITDGTNTASVKAASTLPALTDIAVVTTQRDPLPAGTNVIGHVINDAGSAVIGHVIADASSAVIGHVIADSGSTTVVTGTVTVGTHDVGSITTAVVPGTGATNLGKAEDAAHNSGDVGIMSMGVRKDTNAQTTNTDGDYTPGAFDAYGAQFTRVDHPNRIRCTVTVSTQTTIQAVGTSCAAPGPGLSIYITDIEFSSSASGIAADAFPTLKYGTGGTCGTGTIVFWGALSAAAIRAEKSFATPIKIPANNEICWITSTAGSKFLVITGYIAP